MNLRDIVNGESMEPERADEVIRVAPWAIAGSTLLLAASIAAGIAICKYYHSGSDNKLSEKVETVQNYGGQR